MYISILIAGFGGGILRGLVGFIKHQYSYKNVAFRLPYFLLMVSMSGAIGIISAIVVKELGISFLGLDSFPASLAVIIGYAGGDFLENIYKVVIKKPSLYLNTKDSSIES